MLYQLDGQGQSPKQRTYNVANRYYNFDGTGTTSLRAVDGSGADFTLFTGSTASAVQSPVGKALRLQSNAVYRANGFVSISALLNIGNWVMQFWLQINEINGTTGSIPFYYGGLRTSTAENVPFFLFIDPNGFLTLGSSGFANITTKYKVTVGEYFHLAIRCNNFTSTT